MTLRLCCLAVMLALAGCGRVTDLEPAEGSALPPPVYGQTERPDAGRLLEAPSQARPQRSDEILTRSETRPDDPFDIPPGDEPASGGDPSPPGAPIGDEPAPPR